MLEFFAQHLETLEADPQSVTVHDLAWLINSLAGLVPLLTLEEWNDYDDRIEVLASANAGTRNLADHGHLLDEGAAKLQALFEAALQ